MSLSRALEKLSSDDHTECVLREILALFGSREREWLSEDYVEAKTGFSFADIHSVLSVLSDSFVLDFDRTERRYRFVGDVALGYEIDLFMRRVDNHQSHVRTNVARFRERHGY
ncbi:MAG: hypothetical protein JXA36_01995 [Coriobacteriia bacterium]|nr:hypothetical protein [Coriobacteriia bacterium]